MYSYRSVLINFFYLLLFVVLISAQSEKGIQVNVINLHNNKGSILVNLFRDDNGYPSNTDKAFRKAKVNISNNAATVFFPDLPAGKYAVAVLHDENEDHKMNKNFLGYPKEGFGFSNNVIGMFGPPSFNKSGFQYTPNSFIKVTIRVRY
jgi:uncharacterized protein (DUF2141 family)